MTDPKTLETFMGFLPNRLTNEVIMYYTLRGFTRDVVLYVSVPKSFDDTFGDKPFTQRFPDFHVCNDDEPNIYGKSIMENIIAHKQVREYAYRVGELSQETINSVFELAFNIENEVIDMRKKYLEDLSMRLVVSIIEGIIDSIQHDIIEPYGVSGDIVSFHNELVQTLPFLKRYGKDIEEMLPEHRIAHEVKVKRLLEDLASIAESLFEKYSDTPMVHVLAPFLTNLHNAAHNHMRELTLKDDQGKPLLDAETMRNLEEAFGDDKK